MMDTDNSLSKPEKEAKEKAAKKVGPKKKLAPGSVNLQVAGDLLLARCPDREMTAAFKRYEALLEKLANMERDERIINYHFLVGLILTSHAKRTHDRDARRKLFDRKNDVFFKLANSKAYRKKLSFLYLVSKNFRVIEFCDACKTLNEQSTEPKHKWKSCRECNVDRKFYNVLAIHHKFQGGSASMFLSNDLMNKVVNLKPPLNADFDDHKEEARFLKFRYNTQTLAVFSIDSTMKVLDKLLAMPVP